MKYIRTNWSKDDLQVYLLLFCINANWSKRYKNKQYLINDLCINRHVNICREFENDNDYQGIQKILYSIERWKFSKEQSKDLFKGLKATLMSKTMAGVSQLALLSHIEKIVIPIC